MDTLQRHEEIILNQLLYNDEYFRKVIPHLKSEYFEDRTERYLFNSIKDYVSKYNVKPTYTTLSVTLNNKSGILDDDINSINEYINEILSNSIPNDYSYIWLIDKTEEFCKDRAVYNAIVDSMGIINGDDKNKTPECIPDLMKSALKINFDVRLGLEYFDVLERERLIEENIPKIPFDIRALNIITKGGLSSKTLNCILAGTGIGKTMFMCHYAASTISQGKNVLYITLEMSEEKIASRIDANLMDIDLNNIESMNNSDFINKLNKIIKFGGFLSRFFKKKKLGKLFIKEYPTSFGNTNHFKSLIDDLELKKDFKPDVVIIDYINICASTRVSPNVGSYNYIKSIAEELRGMAVEYDVVVLTATQTNRNGYDNNDVNMGDTAESFGLPHTLDLYLAIMQDEELEKMNRFLVKQLKNRYSDVSTNKYFTIGVDKPKMRIYHVDDWNAGRSNSIDAIDDVPRIKDNIDDVKNATDIFDLPNTLTSDNKEYTKKNKFTGVKF